MVVCLGILCLHFQSLAGGVSGFLDCPGDIIVDGDPALESGAFVEYEYPEAVVDCKVGTEEATAFPAEGYPASGDFFIEGTTQVCLEVNPCGELLSCCFNVTVQCLDDQPVIANCVEGVLQEVRAAYVTCSSPPWGQNTNEQAMDLSFGAGNWDAYTLETLDPNLLFSLDYNTVYIDGGDYCALELEEFLDNNLALMESWVFNGNTLFLNAASNEGDGMSFGFGGVQLSDQIFIEEGAATDPNHPIFLGPALPTATSFVANYYSHGIICPVGLIASVLIQNPSDPNQDQLVEASWGNGTVFFGALTTTNYHDPEIEALNLRANMLSYLASMVNLLPVVELDAFGVGVLSPEQLDEGSGPACSIASMSVSKADYTCNDVGEQEVTLTVFDFLGGSSECTASILVIDRIAPTALCQNQSIVLDEFGLGEVTAMMIDNGSSDNCGIAEMSLSQTSFDCGDIGENSVVLQVIDTSGNRTECEAVVTVIATPPVLSCPESFDVIIEDQNACPDAPVVFEVFADLVCIPAAIRPLEDILSNFQSNFADINAVVNNQYEFSNGISGTCISDGGGDMYDCGNELNTDLGTFIPYSDNLLVPDASFGTEGQYFTSKQTGLFLMAADLDNVNTFFISGNNGADGSGMADETVLNLSLGTSDYTGFVKRVCDAFDPSINHLIIIADDPGASHSIATDTNDDFHEVTGLANTVRIYYLLFAGSSGYCYSDVEVEAVMQAFLTAIGEPYIPPPADIDIQQTEGLPSGSLYPQGTTTNTFTATIDGVNFSTCSFDVNVSDPNTVCCPGCSAVATDLSCPSGTSSGFVANPDGTITVSIEESNSVYDVDVLDADSQIVASASGVSPGENAYTFTDLPSGEYTVQVVSGNGCDCFSNASIGEPDPLTVTNDLPNVSEGSGNTFYYNLHQVQISGGTPPYQVDVERTGYVRWELSDTEDGTELNIIYADGAEWVFSISDANGCFSGELVVSNLEADPGDSDLGDALLDIDSFEITGESGDNADGSIFISVSGCDGGPYSYEWTGPGGYTASTEDITGLESGSYEVRVSCDEADYETYGFYWVPKDRASGRLKSIGSGELAIFPNPISGPTTLKYAFAETALVDLFIYGSDGRLVYAEDLGHHQAQEPYSKMLDTNEIGLGTGVYKVVLIAKGSEMLSASLLVIE